MESLQKELSVGNESFRNLRNANQIYVDKTEMIFDLVRQSRAFFLARPNGFGKSLLLSTFEELFANGVSSFEGLKISSLWKEKKCQVVRLNFADLLPFENREEFKEKLFALVREAFQTAGFVENCAINIPLFSNCPCG